MKQHAKIGARVRLLYDMGSGTAGRTGVVTCDDDYRSGGYATVHLDGASYSLYLLRTEYVELSPLEQLAREAE